MIWLLLYIAPCAVQTQSHRASPHPLCPEGCSVVSCRGAIYDGSASNTGQIPAGKLSCAPTHSKNNKCKKDSYSQKPGVYFSWAGCHSVIHVYCIATLTSVWHILELSLQMISRFHTNVFQNCKVNFKNVNW